MRCAPPQNKPTPEEQRACAGYLTREIQLLADVKVVLALGDFAYRAICGQLGITSRPKFTHGTEASSPDGMSVICSFHPSQQNTFTRKLTEPMLDAVLKRARELAST